MRDPSRSWLDHAPALVGTFLLAGYGLIAIAGMFVPEHADAIHDGMPGLVFFPTVASLYAAATVLQFEFGFARWWRPGLRQGAAVTWIGGWTTLLLYGVVRQFALGGVAAARDFLGGSTFVWCLFVGLPLVLVFLLRKAAPKDETRAFIDD